MAKDKELKKAEKSDKNGKHGHKRSHLGQDKENLGNGTAHVTAQDAAEALIELALTDGSTDNISAIVVKYL